MNKLKLDKDLSDFILENIEEKWNSFKEPYVSNETGNFNIGKLAYYIGASHFIGVLPKKRLIECSDELGLDPNRVKAHKLIENTFFPFVILSGYFKSRESDFETGVDNAPSSLIPAYAGLYAIDTLIGSYALIKKKEIVGSATIILKPYLIPDALGLKSIEGVVSLANDHGIKLMAAVHYYGQKINSFKDGLKGFAAKSRSFIVDGRNALPQKIYSFAATAYLMESARSKFNELNKHVLDLMNKFNL